MSDFTEVVTFDTFEDAKATSTSAIYSTFKPHRTKNCLVEFERFLPQLIRLSRRAEISRRVLTRLLACSRARLRNGLSWVDHITYSSMRPVDISYMISVILRSLWPFRTPISSLPKSESLQRWRQACFYQISITLFLDLDQL